MDKIETIRAEIERRIDDFRKRRFDVYANEFASLLTFLDTLEEEPDKSLVEEIKRYYSDNFAYISSDQPTLSILTNVARHFAEWGAEHLKK